MNLKLWLNGLVVAVLSAVADALVLPAVFDKASMKQLAVAIGYKALITAVAYLKTHPPEQREAWTPEQRAQNSNQKSDSAKAGQ